MASQTIELTESLYNYLLHTGIQESSIAQELRAKTQESTRWHRMQISPEQGAFMALLIRLIGAKKTIEIGTFTGYSALVVAEALPKDGRVIAVARQSLSISRLSTPTRPTTMATTSDASFC